MVVPGDGSAFRLGSFDQTLLDELHSDDLVIANDTRVLHARLRCTRPGGGANELLLLAPSAAGDGWTCMARPARRLREAMLLTTPKGGTIECVRRLDDGTWLVRLPVTEVGEVATWLLEHGEVPLPPYIDPAGQDPARYQTVHARYDGSVAAPTAGLHFSDELWQRVGSHCDVAHVTLHVGAGTFLPVREGALDDHVMHSERYSITAKTDRVIRSALADGRRIVSIGTTTTRVLEHVYRADVIQGRVEPELSGETDIFIMPGYQWACVGALVTNFHLPKSTLLALVMSFAGIDRIRAAYAYAIANHLRFYSFGDAMLLPGRPAGDGMAESSS